MIGGFLSTGEFFSALCGLLWAVAIVLFRKCGEKVPPVALNVFKNSVGAVLFPLTMILLGIPFFPQTESWTDWAVLLVSGAIGIGVADTLMFVSLNRIGAGRSAIVESGYSPCVIICATFYLSEPLNPSLLLAVALMVGAILVGSWSPDIPDDGGVRRELRRGVVAGVAAVVLMAIGVVIAKPVLERTDAIWASSVRLFGGMLVLAVQGATKRHRAQVLRCFRPSHLWKITVPAAIVGSYLAMFFWILGLKYTYTTTASVLNQLSPIFLLVFATLFLREPLTRRRVAAISMGFAGAVIAVT